jgi:hypothetical protein
MFGSSSALFLRDVLLVAVVNYNLRVGVGWGAVVCSGSGATIVTNSLVPRILHN